jgi:TonB family protein
LLHLILLDSIFISAIFFSVYPSFKIRRAFSILAITVASAFASGAVSRAQNYSQESALSVAHQETSAPQGGVQILTPTDGVDFRLYTSALASEIRNKWYASMPEAALKGEKGEAIIRFRIQSDGKAEDVVLETSSGKDLLDQAAIQAIRDSSPFHPLPGAFKGPSITLRFVFYYNVRPPTPTTDATAADCDAVANPTPAEAPFDRLEALGFVSHNFDVTYAEKIICQRGTDFSPDAATLETFRIYNVSPALVATIAKVKPKTINIPSPDRDRAYKSLTLALSDVREGQPKAADVDYKRALQLADSSASLHLSYAGYLLLQQHQYPEAEAQARRSLEIWPNNAEAYVVLAAALATAGRDADAVPEAREALRIDPEHKSALAILGLSLARSGQYTEAIPALRNALLRAPEVPVIHKHLGGCLVHTRDFDGAIKELTTFLEKNPNDAEAHYLLGVAFREKGNVSDAGTQFREANRIDPANLLYSVMADRSDSAETATADSKSSGPRLEDSFLSGNVYTNTFFGFSYEFPKGWVVLGAEKSKAMARIGGSILANGDPVLADVTEVAARNMNSLLFVGKETTKGISSTFNSIQILALDKRFAPDDKSGEEFAKTMAVVLQHRLQAFSVVGSPERFDIGGKTFWKLRLDVSMQNQVAHCVEAVTIEKGYVILFVFTSLDASKLNDLAGTMFSLRFAATR